MTTELNLNEKFSVCQFFPGGDSEYVRQNVTGQEAVESYKHYTTCVGATMGFTNRVIITDQGDEIVAEWLFAAGHVFPLPPFTSIPETAPAVH
jgi:hypothetical protein